MLGIPADGKHLFTSNVPWGGISEIDLAGKAFARDLAVAPQTEGVAVTPDGATVWIGSNSTGTVSVVDTKSWSVVATLSGLGMPYRIGISPNGTLAVICDPQGNAIHIAGVASRHWKRRLAAVATRCFPRAGQSYRLRYVRRR